MRLGNSKGPRQAIVSLCVCVCMYKCVDIHDR